MKRISFLAVAVCLLLCACEPQKNSAPIKLSEVGIAGESGFIDLRFKIIRTKALVGPDGTRALGIEFGAEFEGKPLRLGLTILREWDRSPDAQLQVWMGTISFLCDGKDSDYFVQSLAKIYKVTAASNRCTGDVIANVVSLGAKPTNLENQPMKLKVFFEGTSKDDYGELYLNVNVPQGIVSLNEKDVEYRRAVIKALGSGQ